jgi:hypothetical protein
MNSKPIISWAWSAVLASVACLASCKGESQGTPEMRPPEQIGAPAVALPPDPSSAGLSEGHHYWRMKCVPCHGATGKGDGPAVKKLTNKPGDLTNPEFQKSLSDDDIYNIILYGGPGVGKSIDMPSYGDLQGRWDILGEIVKTIRGFAKK